MNLRHFVLAPSILGLHGGDLWFLSSCFLLMQRYCDVVMEKSLGPHAKVLGIAVIIHVGTFEIR